MTHDQATQIAAERGISLAHDCNEKDPACRCMYDDEEDMHIDGHAPGDGRCDNRAIHSACSHDFTTLGITKATKR